MSHCCKSMKDQVELVCEKHKENMNNCPDKFIKYEEIFDEYGLIFHDGSSSTLTIKFCPFCGKKLPRSRREEWINELYKIGINNIFDQNIPEKFLTSEWRIAKVTI